MHKDALIFLNMYIKNLGSVFNWLYMYLEIKCIPNSSIRLLIRHDVIGIINFLFGGLSLCDSFWFELHFLVTFVTFLVTLCHVHLVIRSHEKVTITIQHLEFKGIDYKNTLNKVYYSRDNWMLRLAIRTAHKK